MEDTILDDTRLDELKFFYKSRVTKPELFNYDTEGDLIQLNKKEELVKKIELPTYRRPTYEEFNEMEQNRMKQIAFANKEFEDAKKLLRESYANASPYEIVAMNKIVIEADEKLYGLRFPMHYVHTEGSIPICSIDFNQINEKRKYPYPFCFLKQSPYTLQEQYVRTGEMPIKQLSLNEIKSDEPIILFSDPDTNEYGYLSLKWHVEIQFNGTMYHSVHQALYAELAKSFNDEENLDKIMNSPFDYSLEKVPGNKDENEAKWNELVDNYIYSINYAKFKNYPELSLRLLETQNAILGAYIIGYNELDNKLGIGISLDDIKSKNQVNWSGQNQLGNTLMKIREQIREEQKQAQEAQQAQQAQVQRKPARRVLSVAPRKTVQPAVPVAPVAPVAPVPLNAALNVVPVPNVPINIAPVPNVPNVAPVPNVQQPVALNVAPVQPTQPMQLTQPARRRTIMVAPKPTIAKSIQL